MGSSLHRGKNTRNYGNTYPMPMMLCSTTGRTRHGAWCCKLTSSSHFWVDEAMIRCGGVIGGWCSCKSDSVSNPFLIRSLIGYQITLAFRGRADEWMEESHWLRRLNKPPVSLAWRRQKELALTEAKAATTARPDALNCFVGPPRRQGAAGTPRRTQGPQCHKGPCCMNGT